MRSGHVREPVAAVAARSATARYSKSGAETIGWSREAPDRNSLVANTHRVHGMDKHIDACLSCQQRMRNEREEVRGTWYNGQWAW